MWSVVVADLGRVLCKDHLPKDFLKTKLFSSDVFSWKVVFRASDKLLLKSTSSCTFATSARRPTTRYETCVLTFPVFTSWKCARLAEKTSTPEA